MRQFLLRLTLLRLFSLVLGFLLFWIIISPKENHSLYHEEIIYGLFILITLNIYCGVFFNEEDCKSS